VSDGIVVALVRVALTALATGDIPQAQKALRTLLLYIEVP
jgi:hypothetical protein